MKKIIAILLALTLLLAGCSGNSEPQPGTVEQTPNATEADTGSTIDTLPPTEAPTEAPAEEAQVSLGRMEGGVYTNTYAGYGCELSSDWVFYTAEELQVMPEDIAGMFESSDLEDVALETIIDMKADNATDLTTMNINYSKMSMQQRLYYYAMTDEEIIEEVLTEKDVLIDTYAQAGIMVDEMKALPVTFLGEERVAMHTVATVEGIPYYILQIYDYSRGQYSITLTVASYLEDNTAGLLDLFYAVD